jgi:hypothetical protein
MDANKEQSQTTALIDIGANGIAFIDQTFTHKNKLPLIRLRRPCRLEVVGGRQSVAGHISHLVRLPVDVQGHRQLLPYFVTKLSQYHVIPQEALIKLPSPSQRSCHAKTQCRSVIRNWWMALGRSGLPSSKAKSYSLTSKILAAMLAPQVRMSVLKLRNGRVSSSQNRSPL